MIGYLAVGLLLAGLFLFVLEWWARASTAEAKRSLMLLGIALAGLLGLFFISRGQWLIGAVPMVMSLWRFFGIAQTVMRIAQMLGLRKPAGSTQGSRGDNARRAGQAASNGALERSEALQILDLTDPVTADEINAAYKRLMAQCHPDKGGSAWMAERLNAARDTLLKG